METGLPPLASLGVGGALALILFWFYRHDRKASEDRWFEYRNTTDKRYDELSRDFKLIVQENTAASVRLAEVIDHVLEAR
jgi:hypothetical protein